MVTFFQAMNRSVFRSIVIWSIQIQIPIDQKIVILSIRKELFSVKVDKKPFQSTLIWSIWSQCHFVPIAALHASKYCIVSFMCSHFVPLTAFHVKKPCIESFLNILNGFYLMSFCQMFIKYVFLVYLMQHWSIFK